MNAPADPTPTDPSELREDIARTRERLGHTVEALAHKMNVPEQMRSRVQEAKDVVQDKTEQVISQAEHGAHAIQDKADQLVASLPEPLAQPAERLMMTIRQRPLPSAVVGLGALLVLRRLLRRKKKC
ncbi:MAG: DUF3618 domain-containing protein [Kutzneria sp.]|nr:DUF3618 domain-containing protein [Kutzneria sp.]MBV9844666.1 DUF3618 domain-containing protein [Kutzneria sp.]